MSREHIKKFPASLVIQELPVNWDEVREWHGHIYTTKWKTDS